MFSEMRNPNLFHGHLPWNKYEGWYYKISVNSDNTLAFIPGIFMDKMDPHTFIQILWSKNNCFSYYRMPLNSFKSTKNPFSINIDNNKFTFEKLSLNLRNDTMIINAELSFSNRVTWSPNTTSHRSMGYYNFIPFMECYSQVCFMDLDVYGHIRINDTMFTIEKGKGYIEKNWGNAFPYSWIWIQSNCFKKGNISLTASIAHIPFPLGSFRGFLIGFYYNGIFYTFTTMNQSEIKIKKNQNDLNIEVENETFFLNIVTSSDKNNFILCKAPKGGKMIDLVQETLTAKVYIKLIEKSSNRVIIEDTGYNTGIEYGGDQMKILDNDC